MSTALLAALRLPVIQAPMAGVQDGALALAVSIAGGLGSVPCAMLTPAALRAELEHLRAGTDRPYNVNFFCHVPPAPEAAREAAWRQTLAPYYREFGIDAASVPTGGGRAPFDAAFAEVLEHFRPPVVSFHFGLPSTDLLQRLKAWGATVLSSATTVAEACWLEAQGVDAIIAQGVEAVLRLGAVAAQVGSAYLLTPEATTSAIHRAALRSEATQHTALTNLYTGRPARGIVNRFMRELGPMNAEAPTFPLATSAVAPLRAKAEAQGSGDFSPLWCGQNATALRAVPAGQLTRELAGLSG